MSTFSKTSFNALAYAASRPTYPRALFDYIFRYHDAGTGPARWDTALDLGCGTGQATVELTPFKNIVGTDPSAGMVDGARRALLSQSEFAPPLDSPGVTAGQLKFIQASAERLAFLPDRSVDLIISAQACHWFDWSKVWPETARVLRTDGTLAVWVYSELRLPKYPTLTSQLNHFFQGDDPKTSIGPYWQQPGRSILNNHLVAVPDPNDIVPGAFKDVTRSYFTGAYYPNLPAPKPVLMRKRMTWHDLHGYFRTASAFHTFLERNPEDKIRLEGDVAARFWKTLLSDASELDGVAVQPEEEVVVEWPLALILAKRA